MKNIKSILGVLILIFFIMLSFFILNSRKNNRHYETININNANIRIYENRISLYNEERLIVENYIKDGIKEYAIGDINGNSEQELVILSGKKSAEYGNDVIIFSVNNNIKEIGRKDFKGANPWKLVIGDIDGDGLEEISVGVYKESPFHPLMAKRPFVYSFVESSLQPKWRGSRLARPFTDYLFYDIDGDGVDEIVAIEILENNKKLINTYKWKGFGFEGYLESQAYDDILELEVIEDLYITIKEGKSSYRGLIKLKEDNIIAERVD